MDKFKPVTHVIFDLDGTILDTESIFNEGICEVLARYDRVYPAELRIKADGTRALDKARLIAEETELPVTPEEFWEAVKEICKPKVVECTFMPGAEILINHLHDNDVPIAVATSSTQESYELKIQNHKDTFDLFHHVVCGGTDPDVAEGKPAPDIFLVCASRFAERPSPKCCLVIEDAPNGVIGAVAAGMQVVMVPREDIPYDIWKTATLRLDTLEYMMPELFGLPRLLRETVGGSGDSGAGFDRIPALLFSLQGTKEDWQYKTETTEDFGNGFENRTSRWPRGKMLGGSSSINAMLYVRGNKRDYDRWAEMGNEGWHWESVLENFRAVENVHVDALKGSTQFGREGYLGLSWYDSGEPLARIIKESARELGCPTLPAEQPLDPIGYFETLLSIEDGTRQNAAKAFLGKIKHRKNLHVAVNASVTKILIDKVGGAAKGVSIRIGDRLLNVYAKKEVIISGGAINSPQLLMLSGIGPRRHLEHLGIDVVKDLPVGEGLQDHSLFLGLYYKVEGSAVNHMTREAVLDEMYKFYMHRTGMMSQISVTNLVGFLNTRNDSIYPNVEVVHVMAAPSNYILQEQAMLNPKSTGRITLKSKDPSERPLVHHGYFSDEHGEDLQIALEAVRFIERLVQTKTFSEHKPELLRFDMPQCNHLPHESDDYWKCLLRQLSSTFYHPTSTCRMGPKDDGAAVVDPRLRVHGVKNLRVVDASVMPKVTSGNTNAPSMMIGHKAGEMIAEDWRGSRDEL
ncbi:hypothetical protein NQ317_018276 [Molorchus minor]|uniref:Glucose-methanol-choline oxidoreductase N-terminal domain-containing protein n=1 Tax=Molorchus minor TaxID=1323400 RepID=A0ABQ9K3R2_9CUCU|nr:hypothetical protein NQ317_018276 [Molorchus minor]